MNPQELLLKAALGILSPEEAEELRVWRSADEAHERVYRETTDPAFLEREWERRHSVRYQRPLAEMQVRIGRGQQRRRTLWRIAAVWVAVLVLGGGVYLYLWESPVVNHQDFSAIHAGTQRASIQRMPATLPVDSPADVSSEPVAQNTDFVTEDGVAALALITPRGGEFHITLEDGTEVWLNAQSQLLYPETFAAEERRVSVEGEAYFKVASDEHRPFLVETDGQLVRVLGTEFNVRSYAEDPSVQTTLVSGSIAMQLMGAGEAQLVLSPGHQAQFDKQVRDIQVRSVDTELVTSWKDGMFVFHDQTLSQIMQTLSRWYDFEYEFADQAVAATEFMGRIPRYSDFADVVKILESSGGLHFQVRGRHLIISSKS